MRERRSYCEQWEYKYDEIWDIEDKAIDQTIAALEAEKPAEDIEDLVDDICGTILYSHISENAKDDEFIKAKIMVRDRIESFAQSYHAKQCAACKKVEPRKYYPFGQEPIPPDPEVTDDK